MMSKKELFDRCRECWGLDSQILMLVEESNELSVAALHFMRDAKPKAESLDHFAEEIADVQLMIEEMMYYFQIVPMVARHRKEKEKRFEEILQKWPALIPRRDP